MVRVRVSWIMYGPLWINPYWGQHTAGSTKAVSKVKISVLVSDRMAPAASPPIVPVLVLVFWTPDRNLPWRRESLFFGVTLWSFSFNAANGFMLRFVFFFYIKSRQTGKQFNSAQLQRKKMINDVFRFRFLLMTSGCPRKQRFILNRDAESPG